MPNTHQNMSCRVSRNLAFCEQIWSEARGSLSDLSYGSNKELRGRIFSIVHVIHIHRGNQTPNTRHDRICLQRVFTEPDGEYPRGLGNWYYGAWTCWGIGLEKWSCVETLRGHIDQMYIVDQPYHISLLRWLNHRDASVQPFLGLGGRHNVCIVLEKPET